MGSLFAGGGGASAGAAEGAAAGAAASPGVSGIALQQGPVASQAIGAASQPEGFDIFRALGATKPPSSLSSADDIYQAFQFGSQFQPAPFQLMPSALPSLQDMMGQLNQPQRRR